MSILTYIGLAALIILCAAVAGRVIAWAVK